MNEDVFPIKKIGIFHLVMLVFGGVHPPKMENEDFEAENLDPWNRKKHLETTKVGPDQL